MTNPNQDIGDDLPTDEYEVLPETQHVDSTPEAPYASRSESRPVSLSQAGPHASPSRRPPRSKDGPRCPNCGDFDTAAGHGLWRCNSCGKRFEPKAVGRQTRNAPSETPHNPLSGLMRGLAVLSIVVMLAGQGIAAWAIWMSPDIIEDAHAYRIEETRRPNTPWTYEQANELRDQELEDADENRSLGLKLYGGGFLAAIAFCVLANFTLPPTHDRRTKPGTKIATVAVVLALLPILVFVVLSVTPTHAG